MNAERLFHNLLNKLVNAQIDLAAYLQLRRAKGYMSVSDTDHLRDNLFELCGELRTHAPALATSLTPAHNAAFHAATEALAHAAVSMMSGHHDCPSFIAVNPDALQGCLDTLSSAIQVVNTSAPRAHA
ncbi:biofilm formation regulator BssR [Scandinavium sp. V105_16]|uniref:Biofilm formation regulator BssR n=1 Tax=Scandinavium lactucae TaxID=3095028 RepID=A0AAJ2VUN4_9ENTR|nr:MULTISPECIES: biofilm formation regulator BssR [unclassified Scandinavium]MDX6022907.1 biofilm formation regulator BssR [Scandinavium sp. V105_16]MDX6033251.1 biofilm formation regulator BssR [Scandinavium sp. V105_12]